MAKRGKPVKKPATVTPVKAVRVMPNGGRLNSGGSWPNSGRPPSELRALAREGVEKALPNVVRIAENPVIQDEDGKAFQVYRDADAIAAFNALVKLGVPSQTEVGESPESPVLTPEERMARARALLQ